MDSLNKADQQTLINLAFRSIKQGLSGPPTPPPASTINSQTLYRKQGSFVTLYLKDQLHGCVGHTEPIKPLYQDVYQNAYAAAFKDPRFNPITSADYPSLSIEISILSPLHPITAHQPQQILQALRPNIHGVVIQNSINKSTFLPQVWQKIPQKEVFLAELCHKASLPSEAWKDPDTKLYTYTIQSIPSSKIP
jgi:AmmeMemoRadiSam system protein A